MGGVGACDVLPLRKGEAGRKGFSHAEGGCTNIFWVVVML